MQSIKQLERLLDTLAVGSHYLFASADLRSGLADCSDAAYAPLLTRACRSGLIERVCRGIYLNPRASYQPGLVLYHAAARLRVGHYVYLSLESVLSNHGIISQVPINRITLVTSGRNGEINCGRFGRIEFTHSKRLISDCADALSYADDLRLWIASPQLAYRDLTFVGRNRELVDLHALETLTT